MLSEDIMIKRTLLLSLLLAASSLQAQDQTPPADNTPAIDSSQAQAQAPAANNADAANALKEKVDSLVSKDKEGALCFSCHMDGGNGNNEAPEQPKLAGQHAEYLYKQMRDFKSVDGRPAVRMNGIMNAMIFSIPDDETMKGIAEFYAKQEIKPAAPKNSKDPDFFKLGEKIWRAGLVSKGLPACSGCHGPAGKGIPAQYPALAGQFPEYLEVQMKAFRDGARANDPEKMMRDIVLKMTDPEIKAVADYAAGLR